MVNILDCPTLKKLRANQMPCPLQFPPRKISAAEACGAIAGEVIALSLLQFSGHLTMANTAVILTLCSTGLLVLHCNKKRKRAGDQSEIDQFQTAFLELLQAHGVCIRVKVSHGNHVGWDILTEQTSLRALINNTHSQMKDTLPLNELREYLLKLLEGAGASPKELKHFAAAIPIIQTQEMIDEILIEEHERRAASSFTPQATD